MTRAFHLLALLLTLTACQKETLVEKANREGIFLMGNSAEPKSLDHQMVTGVPESKIIAALFEGLVGDHPTDDAATPPGAAASWTHNEDKSEWTFKLQPEGRWSDGEAVTAHDFVFSYHRMLSPDLIAPYVEMLYFMEGAEAYNKNQRGRILFEVDAPTEGPSWDEVSEVNFSGDPELDISALNDAQWTELDEAQKADFVRSKGLDALGKEQLEWILTDPDQRFSWPAGFQSRRTVVERLHQYADLDLWDQAGVGVEAIDELTLFIKLKNPVPFLPSLSRHYTWFPVPRHVILRHGKMSDRFTDWSELENLVGNGPFKIAKWRFHDVIEVERNSYYWDAANVHLNGIRFFPIENPFTEARAFRAGQLHTTYGLPDDLIENVEEAEPESLRQEPYVGTVFVRVNTTRPALSDPRVRHALSLVINRDDYCTYIKRGYLPARSLTPKMGDYEPEPMLEFDPEKGRRLLAEAGFPGGKGFPRYSMLISRPAARASAEALQAMWREHLGILVEIENKDWGSYISAQQNLEYDMAAAGWIGDYLDPTTFLNMWTEGNGNNNTGWHSESYERLLNQAAQEADPAKRNQIMREAEKILMQAEPIIPVSWFARNYLLHPAVKGWYPLLLDNHPWKDVRLEPAEGNPP